jgi:hypothetical protein
MSGFVAAITFAGRDTEADFRNLEMEEPIRNVVGSKGRALLSAPDITVNCF